MISDRTSVWVSAIAGLAAISCGTSTRFDASHGTGQLRVALQSGAALHDVTAVRFEIVPEDAECGSQPLAARSVAIDGDGFAEAGSGPETRHPFSDALFVLAPGTYHACATPLADDAPSSECAPASALADVSAGKTHELSLILPCVGPGAGGLDVMATLNSPPALQGIVISPSKFISVCEAAAISVDAEDPDGDALSYAFELSAGPDGGKLSSQDETAQFFGPAGDYSLRVIVSDPHGASSQLEFPVHIADADCEVPTEVADIFNARCSPCHTERASGGLALAPAAAAYANLVGQNAAGNGCMDAVRVVPGSASDSYLIAKLRGQAEVCGLPMPRNLPPLPEEELAAIEGWIDALPH